MHHRCIVGEFRHLGLARGTNIIMHCSSLDFLCILQERFKLSSVASGMGSETTATYMATQGCIIGMIGQHRDLTALKSYSPCSKYSSRL